MAEIKIEKKKPIWPWIIALLLIAAVIYFIFCRDNNMQSKSDVIAQDSTQVDTTTSN